MSYINNELTISSTNTKYLKWLEKMRKIWKQKVHFGFLFLVFNKTSLWIHRTAEAIPIKVNKQILNNITSKTM